MRRGREEDQDKRGKEEGGWGMSLVSRGVVVVMNAKAASSPTSVVALLVGYFTDPVQDVQLYGLGKNMASIWMVPSSLTPRNHDLHLELIAPSTCRSILVLSAG